MPKRILQGKIVDAAPGSKRARVRRTTIKRGAMTKHGKVIGTALDGTIIYEPKMKPSKFSKNELRKAVRDVKKTRLEQSATHVS